MSPGKNFCNSSIRSRTAAAVAIALPLLDSMTAIPTAGLPFNRVEVAYSWLPNSTRATSFR